MTPERFKRKRERSSSQDARSFFAIVRRPRCLDRGLPSTFPAGASPRRRVAADIGPRRREPFIMLTDRYNPEHILPPSRPLPSQLQTLLIRIQGEYREMPGLILSESQARRLWGLDRQTCGAIMTMLIEQHVLKRTPDGAYVRASA
jgi:hypothetical protein